MKKCCYGIILLFSILLRTNSEAYLQKKNTPPLNYVKPHAELITPCGLDPIDCVYIINLDYRPEKFERVKQLFEERGIPTNRFSAVDGWAIAEEAKIEMFGPYPVRLSGGKIGCLLSHLSVMQDAVDRDFSIIWVCEDDLLFKGDEKKLPDLICELTRIDPDWDVLYTDPDMLGSSGQRHPSYHYSPRPDQNLKSLSEFLKRERRGSSFTTIGQRWGNHSYIMSRKGLKKTLDYFRHVYLWDTFDTDRHYVPGIRQYGLRRALITNDWQSKITDSSVAPTQ
ncbi:glycosyltransferase family 25 protein [Estrella lausannensis]|uniref:Glycosyltransferase n=1 Tax=Estrella lausannensis TaxID=483423 RepID=A0A0H5DQC5_9BACT|nr:glycosyltransferase family 25 protein [Estrella lausannensis]CRX38268.1 Glycosyltransferase [Estrella lausannensis]